MDVFEKVMSIIIVLFVGGVILMSPFVRYSTERGGRHTGYITAVDQEGILFPNYQVFVKTDRSSSQEERYCVNRNNKELGEKLQRLSEQAEPVTIKYDGVRGIGLGLCRGEEIYEVVTK